MANGGSAAVAVGGGVVFYLLLMGVILYFALRWSRRIMESKTSGLRAELERLGGRAVGEGERGGLYSGTETQYELGGQTIHVKSYYVSRDFVRINLRVDAAGPLPWITAYPEGAIERFGKAIGLNREVQLGDKEFDDAIYIDSPEDDEKVKRALDIPEVRGAILDLVRAGYKVQLSARGIEIFQIVYAMSTPDVSRVPEAVARFAILRRHLPSFAGETLKKSAEMRGPIIALIGLMAGGAAASGVLMASGVVDTTLDPQPATIAYLGVGGGLWLLANAAVVLWIRGKSTSLRLVMLTAFISLITVPMGGGSFALWLNQKLDSSPAEEHIAAVRSKARKGRTIRVISWRQGHEWETTIAPGPVFRELKVGDKVAARVHQGAFGWAWIEPLTGAVEKAKP